MKKVAAAVARMRFLDWLFLIACLAILAFYVPLTVSANSDLAAGRFALFMDERITFDGVKKILHPNDISLFLYSVIDGGDHRYGRTLWNSIAIFSAIPERLFGDYGQIVATRMLQVILVVVSYFVFAFGILRNWFLRLVLLVAMLTIPSTDYYMTMPKPEPLQLLFLAIFCYFFVKRNAAFSWYWILIGLAFGTKISTLPALLVFIAIALLARSKNDLSVDYRKPLINAAIAFFLGLAIAVPILFSPLLLSVGGYFAFDWVVKKFSLDRGSRITIAITVVVTVFFASRKILNVWVLSTFLNTTHGADQASINALSWVNYIFDEWLIAPYTIGLALFILIFGYLILYGAQIWKSDFSSVDQRTTAFAIAIAGLVLNIAIILGAKRLWGFYLYPGTVLMVAGILMMADLSIACTHVENKRISIKTLKILSSLIPVFLLLISGFFWAPKTIDSLRKLALRTNETTYRLQYLSYKKFVEFLENYNGTRDRRLRVMFSPLLFPPNSNSKFEIVEFWGRYTKWNEAPDIIILDVINTPRGDTLPNDSQNYIDYLAEREGYIAHVGEKGAECKSPPCFVRELELPNGGEVLVLSEAVN